MSPSLEIRLHSLTEWEDLVPQYGWLLDYKLCIECRACEAACKQWNNLDTGIQFRKVKVTEAGKFPNVRTQALSLACNHCEKPACVDVCPVKTMKRNAADGSVNNDQKACIGCQLCVQSCPYEAPVYNTKTRTVFKCSMCTDRLAEGLEPACAALCPTGALKFLPWEEILAMGASDKAPNFTDPSTTLPRIRFVDPTWANG